METVQEIILVKDKVDIVIKHDWDGTLVNTMPKHADLAADVINKHFGMSLKLARRRYLETSGIPFDKQLEKIFPLSKKDILDLCAKEYHSRKISEVYGNPENFPETISVLKYIHNSPGIIQTVSSSTEEEIIGRWVKNNNLKNFFHDIMGRERGTKIDHIDLIRESFPEAFVIFVSDSVGDMYLPTEMNVGVTVPKEKVDQFYRAGATVVTSKPITIAGMAYVIRRCKR